MRHTDRPIRADPSGKSVKVLSNPMVMRRKETGEQSLRLIILGGESGDVFLAVVSSHRSW